MSRWAARAIVGTVLLAAGVLAGGPRGSGASAEASLSLSPELRVVRYDGPISGFDFAYAMAMSPDGSMVYVTGESGGSFSDYATVAYDTNAGGQSWVARFDGPSGGFDVARAVAISPDGSRVYVTGHDESEAGFFDFATIAYDAATGSPLWGDAYDGPAHSTDEANAIAVSPDGSRVYVTGHSTGARSSYDFATIAYDAATGDRIGVARYDGQAHDLDVPNAIAVSPDGTRVVVTGYATGWESNIDYATVAYDVDVGTRAWVATYHRGKDNASDVAVSPDGGTVYVTGFSGATFAADYATVAYRMATGTQRWEAIYNGPANGEDAAAALVISPDGGRIYVTGASTGLGSSTDYATVAYRASTGQLVGAFRYNGDGNLSDNGNDLAVSPDGARLYVTGSATGATGSLDIATVAYDVVTGLELGVVTYNGPSNLDEQGRAIQVSPDGRRVYVSGYGYDAVTGADYVTIAYRSAA